ncbi:kinase-like domain-containing protein [Cladochytrium replicatum]|nr:kinase-like domain-containing protein [Cladochytrium replicatum]
MGNTFSGGDSDFDANGEVELRHFGLLRCIGKGAFGKVRIVEKRDTKKLYALKYINKMQCIRMRAIQNIFRERQILEEIEHPLIVNLRFAFQDDENMFMVIDLMMGGDLRFHLDRIGGFEEEPVRVFAAELLVTLNYLHRKNIVHRDLKPDNTLLDEQGHLHLTDFNIAVHYDPNRPLSSHSGTLAYMAPEIFSGSGYLWQIDFWSLGVLLYECLYGKRPFRGQNNDAITASIMSQDLIIPTVNLATRQPVQVSQEAISVLRGLLTRDPNRRLGCGPMGFEEIEAHPWFKGIDWTAVERKQIKPLFIPDGERANFDATYDLEELLLEDNPLTYRPRKKRKDRDINNLNVGTDPPNNKNNKKAMSMPYSMHQSMNGEQFRNNNNNNAIQGGNGGGYFGANGGAGAQSNATGGVTPLTSFTGANGALNNNNGGGNYNNPDGPQQVRVAKPPNNLTAKEKIAWELNYIDENFKSFDSTMYERYPGIVDPRKWTPSEPPGWVRNLDLEKGKKSNVLVVDGVDDDEGRNQSPTLVAEGQNAEGGRNEPKVPLE